MGRPRKEEVVSLEMKEEIKEIPESIVEKVEKNLEVAKSSGTLKKQTKKIDDETMVSVASFASGRTNFNNKKEPYDRYTWDGFGCVEEVRFGSLRDLRRSSGEDAFKKMLYVLDEEAVKELRLERIYDQIGNLEDLIRLFDKPVEVIINFIDKSSDTVKNVLREIFYNKLERKEKIDLFDARVLSEKLDVELNLEV